jgi:hypothetical protein
MTPATISSSGSSTPRRMRIGRNTLSSAITGKLQINRPVAQPVLPTQYSQMIAEPLVP